jgi:hypothetical protein
LTPTLAPSVTIWGNGNMPDINNFGQKPNEVLAKMIADFTVPANHKIFLGPDGLPVADGIYSEWKDAYTTYALIKGEFVGVLYHCRYSQEQYEWDDAIVARVEYAPGQILIILIPVMEESTSTYGGMGLYSSSFPADKMLQVLTEQYGSDRKGHYYFGADLLSFLKKIDINERGNEIILSSYSNSKYADARNIGMMDVYNILRNHKLGPLTPVDASNEADYQIQIIGFPPG